MEEVKENFRLQTPESNEKYSQAKLKRLKRETISKKHKKKTSKNIIFSL